MRKVVCNTSCLIALSNIGRLNLLNEVYGDILITEDVAQEFGESIPDWIFISEVADETNIQLINNSLDIGESSTIALAMELDEALIILDDGKARRFAGGLGLTYTGTLGVVVKASKMGLDVDLKEIISDFRQMGFRIPNDIENLLLENS